MLTIWTMIALSKVGHKIETVRSSGGQTFSTYGPTNRYRAAENQEVQVTIKISRAV
jgi:hypothetical protein